MDIPRPQARFWHVDDDPHINCEPRPSQRPTESCLLWVDQAQTFVCATANGYSQMHFYNSAAPLIRAVAGLTTGLCLGPEAAMYATILPAEAASDVRRCCQLIGPNAGLAEHGQATAHLREMLPALAHTIVQAIDVVGKTCNDQDSVRQLLFMNCSLMIGRFSETRLDLEQTGTLAAFVIRPKEAVLATPVQTIGAAAPTEIGRASEDWQANVALNGIGLSGPPTSAQIVSSYTEPPVLGSVDLKRADAVLITSQGAYVRIARSDESASVFNDLLGQHVPSIRSKLLTFTGPIEAVPWHGFCARFDVDRFSRTA